LRCKDFEEVLSDYLDGELPPEHKQRLERHLLLCPACSETLRGMHQVRLALQGLGASETPAGFQLRLMACLHEEEIHRKQAWRRSLSFGAALVVALVVALAILLWPGQNSQSELAARGQLDSLESQALDWIPATDRQLGSTWVESYPERLRPVPYSHAQVRTVSY
jgi:anti-sigma factor RsiW